MPSPKRIVLVALWSDQPSDAVAQRLMPAAVPGTRIALSELRRSRNSRNAVSQHLAPLNLDVTEDWDA